MLIRSGIDLLRYFQKPEHLDKVLYVTNKVRMEALVSEWQGCILIDGDLVEITFLSKGPGVYEASLKALQIVLTYNESKCFEAMQGYDGAFTIKDISDILMVAVPTVSRALKTLTHIQKVEQVGTIRRPRTYKVC